MSFITIGPYTIRVSEVLAIEQLSATEPGEYPGCNIHLANGSSFYVDVTAATVVQMINDAKKEGAE